MNRTVTCRNISIGGGNPVSIQSMTNADPHDAGGCIGQVKALKDAGCDIVRLTVPDEAAARVFGKVRSSTDMPLVADIHFDYRMALLAMKNGADKIRINPGNIGGREKTRIVADEAKRRRIPIRVGVNSGSLEDSILKKYGGVTAEGLVESALLNVSLLHEMNFYDIVISIKSSDVTMNTKAYRLISKKTDHPLHIGITEAGTKESGIVKSAVGLGALLLDGIGDTMRVSLTGDPLQEVLAARRILAAAGVRPMPLEIVSCPTCGRTKVDLETIAKRVEQELMPIADEKVRDGASPLKVAVMGCEVNGPGEAKGADFGVACGKGKGLIFVKGEPLKTVEEKEIAGELVKLALSL